MNKEYYKIFTNFAHYYVEIWHQYPNTDKVYIGGKKKCVGFSVYLDDSGKIDLDEYPQLDGFSFDTQCNIAGNHEKGVGSKHLLNTGIIFLKTFYKLESIKIQFTDYSFIECNRYHLPLYIYYTFYYGKTWYEMKFNAKLLYPLKELEIQRKNLENFLETKPDLTPYFSENQKQLKEKIINEYINFKNLKEYLIYLKDFDCSIFKNWLYEIYIKFVVDLPSKQWIIENTSLEKVDYIKLDNKPSDLFTEKNFIREISFS